ncbi:hypothetical protein GEOBRER4_n1599 [Citrifermentans bremense]|uniref:Apea-like HEPN domain-containing protein n=2 Tax=Citrifermentans bremense TaxID=60035 RepID=A0A7R7FSP2_9BACT|nr:hypothetical protein GEOBRER4_n1599 [Citrifermentans bremense]
MTYSFRLRFKRASTEINIEVPVLHLKPGPSMSSLILRSHDPNVPIQRSKDLILESTGYATKEDAELAGKKSLDALAVTLARLRVGADYGHRGPTSWISPLFLNQISAQSGTPILNDVHGLMVYETDPPPKFASLNSDIRTGVGQKGFEGILANALETTISLSERERLSLEMFNASFFQTTPESRLILLVMAVEALIELKVRSTEAVAHVEAMIAATESSSTLSPEDRASMRGSLRWLRNESINQGGRRLAQERLGERMYAGRSAPAFFSYSYGLRSKLVHGETPPPSQQAVGKCAAALQGFVSDLLTVQLKIGV